MLVESKAHWENVYSTKATTEVSWYQEHATTSLRLIQEARVSRSASIIDVGGGASTLADGLLAQGFERLTVLDLSRAALAAAKSRLGSRADAIRWIEADVLTADLPAAGYDLWHDRAVFHFLTSEADRHAYVNKVLDAVRPGGLLIVATFAEDGPSRCSGLPVMRYRANELHAQFGEPFRLLSHEKESHLTPGGREQKFVYCLCRKAAS
jgi:SAM-dependent methyltransferase